MTYILLAIFLYFLYRFTVGFLLPVIRTTSEVKKKMREMQSQQGFGGANARPQNTQNAEKPREKGEYIEFEEIKD